LAEWEAVIGLEVHAQLSTDTKLFCGCSTRFGAAPNTQVCPVCLGLPGALPVLNAAAVRYAVRAGLATSCRIIRESFFERKNYFYPDCPKNYQITQYRQPVCRDGCVTLDDGTPIRITRIHLEEDAGKLDHDTGGDFTLVDMNRSGVPLIEIVSEPVLRSAAQARAYMQRLRDLLRYVGVCDGNMERGNLRCDANVSLRRPDAGAPGVKTEIKNLNSFRFVEQALEYEISRQAGILESGDQITQATLLWDADRGEARPMRTKEGAEDYRYFPEPDLPALLIPDDLYESEETSLPELPGDRAARFCQQYGLTKAIAAVLVSSRELADYFEAVADGVDNPVEAAHWVTGEVLRELNLRGVGPDRFPVKPADLAELSGLVDERRISRRTAKDVFARMAETGKPARDFVDAGNLEQISDEVLLESAVEAVINEHPGELAKYLKGKTGLLHFFVGQTMKKTGGRANPDVVVVLLKRLLGARRFGE
jgi:aspartyl-tRNA(Asn)/glutamyl-tRNA(Gln) amidotransferase subunit B